MKLYVYSSDKKKEKIAVHLNWRALLSEDKYDILKIQYFMVFSILNSNNIIC